nr:ribonuclease H-like domain-containing protein [Tanacetum cinerariifolium]
MTGATVPPLPVLLLSDKLMAITNLHILVPVTLNIDEMNYSSWEYFFQHLCKGHKLLDHLFGKQSTIEVESSALPAPDEEWFKIDNIVLSWIFTTIAKPLHSRIVDAKPQTAKEAWDILAALKAELRSLKLGDLSVDAYFQKVESIFSVLKGLGSPLSDEDVGACRYGEYCKFLHNGVHGSSSRGTKTSTEIPNDDMQTLKNLMAKLGFDASVLNSGAGTVPMGFHTSHPNNSQLIPSTTPSAQACYYPSAQSVSPLLAHQQALPMAQPVYYTQAHPAQQTVQPAQFFIQPGTTGQPSPMGQPSPTVLLMLSLFRISLQDFLTRGVLLRCDSTGDLYPVTKPSNFPHAFLAKKLPVLCHACQLGKHVNSSNTLVQSSFDIVHSDLWTSPISSLSGFKYYVLSLDHYSQYVWVYPLVHKSDVLSKFVLFRTFVRTQFKSEIKSFKCDHGGEFDNQALHKLFVDNGIQFRFSCPGTLLQNDGTLSHYKARLVANGSTQIEGVDADETFSPVVKPGTIWMVLSLVISRHWLVHQFDVKNAFLYGDLSETVLCISPLAFGIRLILIMFVCCSGLFMESSKPQSLVQRFATYITRVGFRQSCCDISLFIFRQGADTAYLLLYVDDIVLTASSETLLQQIIGSFHQEFSMTDLESLNYFLGISVTRDSSGMFLSQRKYVVEILEKARMVKFNSSQAPVDTESKLGDDGDRIFNPTLYRSLAGFLQYLTFTRPDISYAVHQICLYMHDPREPHFSALKQILRYVRGAIDYGLQLFSSSTTSLVAYSDADWVGCPTTRRSTLGYCVFLCNNLLSWSFKRQPTLSRSSAEAEYCGVANAVAKTYWLRNLLRELHTSLSFDMLVYCDNVSAVYLSSNPVQHQRTKHIEIDIHFVCDLVVARKVRVLHVSSRYQFADIFTK